jgi:NAD(P)H-nitrite reductase large subunit
MRFLTGCRYHFSKLAMGMKYLAQLFVSRTAIGHGLKVLEARGNGHLEQVVLAKMDRGGHAIVRSEKTYDVDCLAVGYGFVPNLELPILAGCQLEYHAAKGGWVVKVNQHLQSSVPSIFAAGELTGIAGAEKSLVEGQLAGLAVARQIGASLPSTHKKLMSHLLKRRQQELAFGGLVNQSCRPLAGMLNDLPDATIICRCEDIALDQIRQQIRNGFTTLDAIKKATNSGMGNCQGRTCGPVLQDILSVDKLQSAEKPQPFSIRSPIKPLPLSALAEEHRSESPRDTRQGGEKSHRRGF